MVNDGERFDNAQNAQKQSLEVFCKKKMFLEISQNSQENTWPEPRFNKVAHLSKHLQTTASEHTDNRKCLLFFLHIKKYTNGVYLL